MDTQLIIDLALALAVFMGAVAIMSIPSKKGKK